MSISVKNISVSIDGVKSEQFDIHFEGFLWHLDGFSLVQNLLSPNTLSFTMHKDPVEDMSEACFTVCGQIIGKEITLRLETEIISPANQEENAAEINYRGIILSASGARSNSEYYINVYTSSYDALLDDNPSCKSFESMTLGDIIRDVVDDYSNIDAEIDPRFTETIPYCVQYNESNYQFIVRLAKRYGEWVYNTGEKLVFGNLPQGESVKLVYPSQDIPSYNVDLKMQHVAFSHVASSYNSYDANQKEGLEEMQREYNTLSQNVFQASQDCYTKQTLQNLHSGGYADDDGRETILNVSTKTQARGQKATMVTYSGRTFCSKLKIGGILLIEDNYITNPISNEKSPVNQDEILITQLSHHFSKDYVYSNNFAGIPVACDYPPYFNTDVYPVSPSCRAKVKDNEDPNNLGRVRVQFDWQAQLDDNMMTPWLRVAQPYAGGGKGFSFIPEVGEEVMIDFEGGNAERPYVKGTLYNGVGNPDSLWLPDSNSHNQIKAIRTRNGHTIEIHDEGNDGYIRIYDNEKENYILTFSTDQKLIKLESTGNIELYAKNDIIMHAGHDINASADNDINASARHNRTDKIWHDRTLHIGHNHIIDISKNEFVEIGQNKDEKIALTSQHSAQNIRIEADLNLTEYSTTHQQRANASMSLSAGGQVDVKGSIVKVN